MTNVVVGERTRRLDLSRLSFLFVDEHTSQLQPIMGIPPLVPVPRKVNVREGEATYQIYIKSRFGVNLIEGFTRFR